MNPWRGLGTAALAAGLLAAAPGAAFAQTPPLDPAPVPAPEESGEIVESWALSPAASSTNPDQSGGRTTFSYTVDAGESVDDAMTVFNFSNVTMTFRIYATDAFNNADGAFDILTSDTEPTDVGSWVQIEQEFITLPPNTQATIPFTLDVPVDAAPGDHAGAIVASNTTAGQETNGAAVDVERRTGSRIYLRVNGPVEPNLAVAEVSTDYDGSADPFGGSAVVTYRIENRGNVRLGGTAELRLEGPFGLAGTTVALPAVQELLPGGEVTLTTRVEDVPALFVLRSEVTVTPSSPDGVSDLQTSTGSTRNFTPPIAVLVLLLGVVLGVLAGRSIVRRRRAAGTDEVSAADDEIREPQHT